MHVHVQVVAVRQPRVGSIGEAPGLAGTRGGISSAPLDVRGWKFTLAHVDAARERTRIVLDTVVGDLDVVTPPVYEDAATTLRAVGDGQAIDTRRVAPEVAGEAALSTPEIATRAIPVFILIAVGEQNRSIGESGEQRRIERIRWEERALGQDRNGGSFECTHQARLLQQFGQVAIEAGLPAHSGLQWQA